MANAENSDLFFPSHHDTLIVLNQFFPQDLSQLTTGHLLKIYRQTNQEDSW